MGAQRFARSTHNEFCSETQIVFKPSSGCALYQHGSHPRQSCQTKYKTDEEFYPGAHAENYLNMAAFVFQRKSVTF
jgi:hypothetical protein